MLKLWTLFIMLCLLPQGDIHFLNHSIPDKEEDPGLVLRNLNLINGKDSIVQENMSLLIKDGKIIKIAPDSAFDKDPKSQELDLQGKYLMPGLIDAHVHLGTDPSDYDRLDVCKQRLEYLLHQGITSVRDMAGDTRYLGYLSRSASLGEIESPNIFYSALFAGPAFFDDPRTHLSAKGAIPGDCPWMQAITPETDLVLAVARAKGTGATGIKIYAELNAALIEDIVSEAYRQDIRVWSHGTVFPAKPLPICQAGVHSLSHSTLLAWEASDALPTSAKSRYLPQEHFDIEDPHYLELMDCLREKEIILDATVATYDHERFKKDIFPQGIALTRLAYQSGVKIGVGTDMALQKLSGIAPLIKEMTLLVEKVGMKSHEVLRAASFYNAQILGKGDHLGLVAEGYQADLVVLDKNPLENIGHVSTVHLVVKNGQLYPLK